MELKNESKLVAKLARYGVMHRGEVKNDAVPLMRLLRKGLVRKVYQQGRVFYELSDRTIPLLEHHRKKLLEEAALRALLEQHTDTYIWLLTDVRFFDETHPEAEEFLFLGDWQLTRPLVSGQLELAKLRYYQQVPQRRRRKRAV